jgi:hypothetical protein
MAAQAIKSSVQRFGIRGCVSRMAQESGDHPDAAAERMSWIRQLAAEVPAGPIRGESDVCAASGGVAGARTVTGAAGRHHRLR